MGSFSWTRIIFCMRGEIPSRTRLVRSCGRTGNRPVDARPPQLCAEIGRSSEATAKLSSSVFWGVFFLLFPSFIFPCDHSRKKGIPPPTERGPSRIRKTLEMIETVPILEQTAHRVVCRVPTVRHLRELLSLCTNSNQLIEMIPDGRRAD